MQQEDLEQKILEQSHLIQRFKEQEASVKKLLTKKGSLGFLLLGRGATIFLGRNLTESTKALFQEINTGNVDPLTLGQVAAHIIKRFIRVGLFGILITIIPLLFVAVQTYLLNRQNTLLQLQNEKIDQQTYLIESQRRNALVFELGNVLDAISEETNAGASNTISDLLIGRIAALSRSFRPYRYFQGDTLSKELSPERSQLLTSLIESSLSENTLTKIFQRGDFSQSDLYRANLSVNPFFRTRFHIPSDIHIGQQEISFNAESQLSPGKVYLREIDLHHADLREANLTQADLRNADLSYAELDFADLTATDGRNANFYEAQLVGAKLGRANVENAFFKDANLQNASFAEANLSEALLSGANLTGTNFRSADLTGVNLQKAIVEDPDWFQTLGKLKNPPKGLRNLEAQYTIEGIENEEGAKIYRLMKK